MLALCGVKAEANDPELATWVTPTLVTRPASWNPLTFNRNVNSCSECTTTAHPNGNGAMEDCIQQYWFNGELFQYDGPVCVPFGCSNPATPNFAAYANVAADSESGSPDHFCNGSTELPRNAICVPEPQPGADPAADPTMLLFFAYCLCNDGYAKNNTGGVPINFECTSNWVNECDIEELNKCDRRSDCIELTNENEQGHRCDCKDGFEAGGDLRQVLNLMFWPFDES